MHTWRLSVFRGEIMPKEFKTINEQIDLLKSRGLTISDDVLEEAKQFLAKNNYYRVSGYTLTLRDHDVFYPGTTFQNVMDIYHFDSELRNMLLWAIEIIEVNIKSRYAYLFSRDYGGLGYMDPSNFTDYDSYISLIAKVNKSITTRLNQEAYLQHYIKDLKEPLPIWAYVDLFTMTDISKLYKISSESLKKTIAAEYGLTHNRASEVLTNYLHCVTIIRNLCAHDSRLFNRLFITKPDLNKKELKLLNKKNNQPENDKLFSYILVIRRMLIEDEFSVFKSKLTALCAEYPFVGMKHYGFCPDWEKLI